MLNGRLVREYAICAEYGEPSHIGGNKYPNYGWFYCNGRKLCRNCARKNKII